MCCGDGIEALQEAAMEEQRTVRVFTAEPGAVITLGGFGTATNDTPVLVTEKVAKELKANKQFRIETPEAHPTKAKAASKEKE
jgi:hypothetical protein